MKLVARTVKGYRRKRRLPRNSLGMRKRRVGRVRRTGMRKRRIRRGGFLGNILRGIHNIARSVPIVSTALRATGNPLAGTVAGALGYGKRRRRVRRTGMRKRRVRRGGFMKGFMGAIPLALNRGLGRRKRRVRRGGFKRRGNVTFGGYKRRGYVQWGGLRHAPRRPLVRRRIISRSGMRRVRRGRGIMDMLRKAHSFAKENKLISRGLSMIPHRYAKTAGTVASSLGYGRRMRLRRRVGMRYLPNVSRF